VGRGRGRGRKKQYLAIAKFWIKETAAVDYGCFDGRDKVLENGPKSRTTLPLQRLQHLMTGRRGGTVLVSGGCCACGCGRRRWKQRRVTYLAPDHKTPCA